MNRLSLAQQANIAAHLAHGTSVQSTASLCRCTPKTVLRNILWLGAACQRFHDRTVIHLKPTRIEADECWGFVYAKPENVPEHMSFDHEVGETWTWVSYDPDAKLVVNWHVGKHTFSDAQAFIMDLARRIPGRVQITTDQLAHYRSAIEEAFGDRCDYATIRKVMHEPTRSPDLKYQQPRLRENRKASVYGKPDTDFITTTGIESQNTRLRCWNRRMVREAITFSRSLKHMRASIALHFCYANFCRVPRKIRCTPAMQAGLTDHLWEVEELIERINIEAVRQNLS